MASYYASDRSRREILKISAALAGLGVFPQAGSAGAVQPAGQLTWALHFTLAPTLFNVDN